MYILNGEKKEIDMRVLGKLIDEQLPDVALSRLEKTAIMNEFNFRLDSLEIDKDLLKGKSVEEYYFKAFKEYILQNGTRSLLQEEDDCNIFDLLNNSNTDVRKNILVITNSFSNDRKEKEYLTEAIAWSEALRLAVENADESSDLYNDEVDIKINSNNKTIAVHHLHNDTYDYLRLVSK